MKTYASMKINENRWNSWSPNSFSFFKTSHLTCRKQLEYLCRHMSRQTVSYDMWWLQSGPSSPATYVMGWRVGMDTTQQVKIHFSWDNLILLHTYSLLVYSSPSRSELKRSIAPSPSVVFALKSRRFVRSCPKKVEKTSSENTTFEHSEHPYRTCGSPG